MSAENEMGHWSDCAFYNAPAYEPGPCNCGGLDLAAYERYCRITSLIPTPRSLAEFVENGILPSPIETEESPALRVSASAPATDLKGAHDGIAVVRGPDCMDLNNASKSIVRDGEPFSGAQRITDYMPPHNSTPDSSDGDDTSGGEK